MILIVEDDPDDSLFLTWQLARVNLDHQVRVIADGQKALDYLLRVSPPPYAVFLDLRLPRLSGIEVLRQIRREPRLQWLPVIVLTGSIDPADEEICARLGVSAYLPKPLNIDFLQRIILYGNSRWTYLPRPVDPHLADVASSMLHDGT